MENPQSAGALQQEEDIVAEPSMKTVVVKPHRATDGTQLDLNVNDIVYVLEQDETGWWGGHKEGEDITGWFPGSCVRILPDQPPLERAQEQQPLDGEADHEPVEAAAVPLTAEALAEAAAHHSAEVAARVEPQASADTEKSRQCESPKREVMSPPQRCSLGGRPVASPQRTSTLENGVTPGGVMIPGTPAVDQTMDDLASALGAEPAAGKGAGKAAGARSSCGRYSIADVENLAAENQKLLQANNELGDCLKRIQRQSDATHNNLEKLEVAAQIERERNEALERKLQAEAMEKTTILTEAEELKLAFERHRRESQAQLEATEQMQKVYENKLQEKMDEVRTIEDSSRKVVLSEKQRVRQLEEQIVLCQQELETVRRVQRNSIQAEASAAMAASSLQEESTRRRLFSSTTEMENVGGGFTPVAQRQSPIEEQTSQVWGQAPAPSPTSASRMAGSPEGPSRGRAEAGRTPPTGPRSGVPPAPPASYVTGGSRGASVPRIGAPRPSAPSPCAATQSMGHARSAGDLGPSGAASARHRSSSVIRTVEEEPPRGIVANTVAAFNSQIAKTRESTAEGMRNERSSSRCGPRSRQSSTDGRASRAQSSAAKPYGGEYGFGGYSAVGSAPLATVVSQPTKAAVPTAPLGSAGRLTSPRVPGGLMLPTEQLQEPENMQEEEQIFMGMSPMRKNRSEAPEVSPRAAEVSAEGVSVFARIRKLEVR